MSTHRHTWIASTQGLSENPGVWDTGNGAMRYREICACGAQRERIRSYCGRGGDTTHIMRAGEPGYSITDAQQARALTAD